MTQLSVKIAIAVFACNAMFGNPASVHAARTYFVAPNGADRLSTAAARPGSLGFAAANAREGSRVVLGDGSYDAGAAGYTVTVSDVSFLAAHWHGARIINPHGDNLLGSGSGAVADVCMGIVFGPCAKPTSGGWSGGGGAGWKFVDCEFTHNDGVGFGKGSLVLHCLFTDAWFNCFDVASPDFTMRNCIERRDNRANGDSDSIGNKEDGADNLVFDGLIDYDNNGPGLWFDTDNKNWVVKNSTFFANHGGSNWYTLGVAGGKSTTQFTGDGQDGGGVAQGAKIMATDGTAANLGFKTNVAAVTGYNPMTITVSPALPTIPAAGDVFIVMQGGSSASGGVGLMSEANPNGSFVDNVTYSNTDAGFLDADSGDGYGVAKAGVTITGNRFFFDGITFRAIDGGPGNPTRKLGPATVERNTFVVGPMTGRYAFHVGGTNGSYGYPGPFYKIRFDHNIYSPAHGYSGPWATWYIWTNYPKPGWFSTNYAATGLAQLRNPATFDQDRHSTVASVALRGPTVAAYNWPPANDTRWADIYCPNNAYSRTASLHQVDDDETPYIERAVSGKRPGQKVSLTVFGHTAFTGTGPYKCDVYDYSGRWIALTMRSAAAVKLLDEHVPAYAVLTPSTIAVTLTCDPDESPYELAASYQ